MTKDGLTGLLKDENKVKQYLPMLEALCETFIEHDKGEFSVSAIAQIEDGKPILRVVTFKKVKTEEGEVIALSRNVKNEKGDDLKFDLLTLLTSYNAEEQ